MLSLSLLLLTLPLVHSAPLLGLPLIPLPILDPTPSPPIPSLDPFYSPPTTGLASLPNGYIIRSRGVQAAYLNGSLDAAYQVLYKTSSQNGTALATVASIYVPKNAARDRFVVENLFEDATSTTCAPSYSLRQGASKVNVVQTVPGALDINRFLGAGWIVVSPDYEGPDSTFGAARASGRATLDSARAALLFPPLSLSSNAKLAINGYSGGAFAAGWAAALQPTYAPELNLVGVAQGGTPANATATLEYLDGGIFAGFGFAAVLGITHGYQGAFDLLQQIGTQKAKDAFASLDTPSTTCTLEILLSFVGQRLLSTAYQSLGDRLLQNDFIKTQITPSLVLGVNPAEIPQVPLFVWHGAFDEIIPIAPVNKMVQSYCSAGARVQYQVVPFNDHILGAVSTDPTPFIADRFAGKPVPAGCTYSGNTTAISANVNLNVSATWGSDPTLLARTSALLGLSDGKKLTVLKGLLGISL